MFKRITSASLANLWALALTSFRLFASGLFKPSEYCELTPGLNGNHLKAYVHVIRHGVRHSAFLSRDPLSAWLLPEIISGRISPWSARQIKKDSPKKDGGVALSDPPFERGGVKTADYICTSSYLKADFEACLDVLANTSPNFRLKFCHLMLRGPFHLDDIQPFMPAIHDAFSNGFERNNIDALKMYRDLCVSCGSSLKDIANITQHMVKLAGSNKNSSNFYLGFLPVNTAPPTARISETYGDYALFQDVAAKNALRGDDFFALRQTDNGWEVVSADKTGSVGICVPPPEIWVNAAPFATTVKDNFKGLLAALDRNTIVPFIFPYCRDISKMQMPCDRLISYHTYAAPQAGILHYKESCFKGLCAFDVAGYSGAALSASESEYDNAALSAPSPAVKAYRDLHMKGHLSKYEQTSDGETIAAVNTDLPRRYIFIALQVSDDSAAKWHNINAVDMVRACCEAVQNEDLCVIVKPHPKDNFLHFTRRVKDLEAEYPALTIIDGPLEPLLQNAEIIVTANSGVGLEALLYNKTVITTGLSEYRTASIYAPNVEALKANIVRIVRNGSSDQTSHWINNFFETNLWNGRDPLPDEHVISRFFASL